MSVGFNLIFLRADQISNLKSTSNIEAFKGIDKVYETAMMPQFKTRMVEAAACKTLMLIYKDDWNVIEEWFEPNKHFLYWESFEQLENLISEVSTNYEKYWPIVEAANEHVQQYSIDKLINNIK
jgi:carbamate kinase